MKTIRAILALFLFCLPLATLAQTQLEYQWVDRQAGVNKWALSGSTACTSHAESLRIHSDTYVFTSSSLTVNSLTYTESSKICSFRFYNVPDNGTNPSYTGYETLAIPTRPQQQCIANAQATRLEWGCWAPSSIGQPTDANCYAPTMGSTALPKTVVINNCQVQLNNRSGWAAQPGATVSGWTPWAWTHTGALTGTVLLGDTPPFSIPEPPPAPPEGEGGDGDGDGDPDDGTTTPLQCGSPPNFYTEQYPQGISGVIDNIKLSFQASSAMTFLNGLVPNYTMTDCPSFSITMMNSQTIPIDIPCSVWSFIKTIMILSAMFFAVRLIFGGA